MVSEGRPNIICDWQGSSFNPTHHKTLMFEGHTDVVTEGDASAWTYPPFEGRIVDGKLYGRGSADMKAGVAAAIAALEAIRKVAPDLPGRIRLGIVADEEGMMTGIKHFITQGHANDVDSAIICEPEENELCLFQKGALRVNVIFTGIMSHGAMPYAGVNPIVALSSFLEHVKTLQQQEQQRLGEHEYLGLSWFTPTIIKSPLTGEAQHNVMPEQAYLALDIRTVPGQNHNDILGQLNDVARGLEQTTPHLKIEVDCFESRPWTETAKDNPLVKAIETAYSLVFNQTPKYGGVPGATDGTFLHAWAKVPIVTIGPGLRTIPHQRDEYVDIEDIVNAARLYAAAAIYFLASP
jgi:succinyl-diaminopimelate desuccinylase